MKYKNQAVSEVADKLVHSLCEQARYDLYFQTPVYVI